MPDIDGITDWILMLMFNPVTSLLAGLVLIGTGLTHLLNPADSMLATGLLFIPALPEWAAMLAGVPVTLIGVITAAGAVISIGSDRKLLG